MPSDAIPRITRCQGSAAHAEQPRQVTGTVEAEQVHGRPEADRRPRQEPMTGVEAPNPPVRIEGAHAAMRLVEAVDAGLGITRDRRLRRAGLPAGGTTRQPAPADHRSGIAALATPESRRAAGVGLVDPHTVAG